MSDQPKQVVVANQDDNPVRVIDAYTGLGGFFRQWASLGVTGVVSGLLVYMITMQLPATQDKFHDMVKEERTISREELEKSRKHGEEAVKTINQGMKDQWKVIGTHHDQAIDNQRQMIDIMKQQLKATKEK